MERSAVTKLVPDFIWIDLGRQAVGLLLLNFQVTVKYPLQQEL